MRPVRGFTVLTIAFLAMPLACAAPSADPATVWTDPEGDVTSDSPVLTGDRYPNADLLALEVREVPSGFWFKTHVAAMNAEHDGALFSSMEFTVPVQFAGHDFELAIQRGGGTILYFLVQFLAVDEDGRDVQWRADSWNDDTILVNPQEGWIEVFVPRTAVTKDGEVPGPGDALTIGQVQSQAENRAFTGELVARATDAMPDDPTAHELAVTHGAKSTGDTWMSVEQAFRSSNGGAGGYLYDLTIHNGADHEQTYLLRSTDADSQVTVKVPDAGFSVPAGGNLSVPAYIEVPFGHQHGGFVAATVEAASIDSEDMGRAQIGVEYLAIPQPAGHHDELFFHTRQISADSYGDMATDLLGSVTRTEGFMNAAPEDDLDTGGPIHPYSAVPGDDGSTTFTWIIELDPRLDIGLDFRTEDAGTLTIPFDTPVPLDGELSGRLIWIGPREGGSDPATFSEEDVTVLGTLPTQAVTLDDGAVLEPSLALTEVSDHVVYVEGSDLLLEITFGTAGPRIDTGDLAPTIAPGGSMQVPLNEYRDPILDVFSSSHRVTLDDATRRANPGDTLITHLTLEADAPATVSLSATSDVLDVTFPEGDSWSVAPDAPATVPAIIEVPEDAPRMESIPVFFLLDTGDVPAGAILSIDIVDEDIDDDRAAADALRAQEQATPAPFAAGLGLVLVAAALRRRQAHP